MIFKEKPLARWDEELSRIEVCHAMIQDIDEVLQTPCFLSGKWSSSSGRKMVRLGKTLGIPVKLTETPGSLRTLPVGFGENSREVLRELGYSEEIIEDYSRKGIV